MLKVAATYNVALDPINPQIELQRRMPVWYHIGVNRNFRVILNGEWQKCQRSNHGIITVGEMSDYAEGIGIVQNRRCNGYTVCACPRCQAGRAMGCRHPEKCRQAGRNLLSSLHSKWVPTGPATDD
ncbi:hypothetical protein BJ912DRAFT_834109, partial [Pholiota molesta]